MSHTSRTCSTDYLPACQRFAYRESTGGAAGSVPQAAVAYRPQAVRHVRYLSSSAGWQTGQGAPQRRTASSGRHGFCVVDLVHQPAV